MSETKKEIGLKPCPFCGGEAVVYKHGIHTEWWFAECKGDKCGMRIDRKTKDEVTSAWNHRQADTGLVEDTVANLLCYLVDRYENQPLSEIKLQEIGTQFLKNKHYNKPIPALPGKENKNGK